MNYSYQFETKEEFKTEFERRCIMHFGRSHVECHTNEKFIVLGNIVKDYASVNWKASKDTITNSKQKQMYYFSMEFLIGRLITSNLMNLGIYEVVKDGLNDLGIDINELEKTESDAGLGNGGLGRLAACFLDSLASTNYPGHGNCIRYEYGLFKQKIQNNQQVEVPDQWMQLGNVWEVRKPQHAVDIKFFGNINMSLDEDGKRVVSHDNAQIIRAVPYDMAVIGSNTTLTNTLRLWSAEVAQDAVDYSNFENYIREVTAINHNVYPDDSTESGRYLRLKQQYFFVAAGLDSIVKNHLRVEGTLDNFAEKVAIQLNDTHPVLCIPELMRILLDDYRYEWDDAWNIVTKTMAYTNHTVLQEALEKWPVHFIQIMLPRIYMIIEEIHNRFMFELFNKFNAGHFANSMAIIKDGQVHMANLAIVGSHKVNGVAYLHTEILKYDVFKEFNELFPGKIINKTNGITHRRWLAYSNPELTNLLKSRIGDGFISNPFELEKLVPFVEDKQLQEEFKQVKLARKRILRDYIKKTVGIEIDINSIIDVQAKRLHAYKRQLLNVLHIIYLYQQAKENPNFTMHPRTFIFAAKAAPAYYFAKKVIELIHCIADKVNDDPQVNRFFKVVFIPNYSVSIAEILMNAADVSEQISTAGKEASGTGNMKFMMNGAITLGTFDGANVEICEQVGIENAEIFGLRANEVENIYRYRTYNSFNTYNQNPTIKKVVDAIVDGTFHCNPDQFKVIFEDLIFRNDEYLLLLDFPDYVKAQQNVENRYISDDWYRLCLYNIAKSGFFSSDRTIDEYAKEIWKLRKVF